jgi:glycosyltransferase involved in cell wall biosynthesis
MASRPFLSVVVPLHDDANIIENYLTDLCELVQRDFPQHEVILVDDWSQDDTVETVAQLLQRFPAIRLLRLSRSYGTDIAITAGLETSIGDLVVVMRIDRDPPAVIGTLVAPLLADKDLNIVVGKATNAPAESLTYRLLRSAFTRTAEALSGTRIPKNSLSCIALTRKALNAITRVKQKQRYLSWICCSVGFKRLEVDYAQSPRGARTARRSLLEAFDLGVASLVTSTTAPLRWVSYAGLAGAGLNLAYVGYVFLVNLLKSHVAEGWTTLSLQSSSMFLMLFVIQAVMSEYVGRILDETKDRPLYHVVDELGSPIAVYDPSLRNVQEHSTDQGSRVADVAPVRRAA